MEATPGYSPDALWCHYSSTPYSPIPVLGRVFTSREDAESAPNPDLDRVATLNDFLYSLRDGAVAAAEHGSIGDTIG